MNKFSKIICLLFVVLFWPKMSAAYQITNVAGTAVSGDYAIGLGKNETNLNPGEEQLKEIFILNRSGRDLNFVVNVEDFYGSDKTQETVKFSETQTNIYPAKNWLIPEISKFTLKHGEKMTLPVLIRLSKDTTPGGLYGAVMVSAQPSGEATGNQVKTTARLASLFFVRVNGVINEAGALEKFSSNKSFYNQGPIELLYNFKNSGNIYLNPHGEITVTNLWGRVVYKKPITPYFVMPGSTRQQKDVWLSRSSWGIYKATINLSRGYGDMIDRQSVNLYIFPWLSLVVGAVVLLATLWLIYRVVISYKK